MALGGIKLAPLVAQVIADYGPFKKGMQDVKKVGNDATDVVEKGFEDTGKSAEKESGKIKSAFVGAAKVVAGAFAVKKIFDFGKASVEAAATAQAVDAQFEQTFGDIENKAQATVEKLGNEFGMVPNRIKPAFAQVTSMFKGLGLTTEEAMQQAERATTLSADAAAFYDKSMEDAQGSLTSFIKGNYEGGESIGLFANDTQMAAFAIKNNLIEATEEQEAHAQKTALAMEVAQTSYNKTVEKFGVDSLEARKAQEKVNKAMEDAANGPNLANKWSQMSESQKQIIRLDFASEMQKQAGATGQAARESDSLENQMGNAKQAWQDFLAIVGSPILGTVTNGIKGVSKALQSGGEFVKKFQNNWEKLKTPLMIGAVFVGALAAAIAIYSSGITVASIGTGIWTGVASIATGVTTALGTAIAFLTSPITIVIGVMALLVAGFVLAYQKIEPFRNLINGLLEDIKLFAIKVYTEYIKPALDSIIAAFQEAFAKIKEFWDKYGTDIITAVGNFFTFIWTIMQPALQMWRAIFSSTMNIIWSVIKVTWDTIKGVFSGVFQIIGGLIKVFTGVFKGDIKLVMEGVKDIFAGGWKVIASGVEGFSNAVLKVIAGLANGMKNGILGAVNGVVDVINKVIEFFGGDGMKKLSWPDWVAPTVKLPRFERGSDGIPQDMYGVVNDQSGAHYREMIVEPNGRTFIPEGRNVVMPLKKGTQILPANMTKDFLPHFKGGIGSWVKDKWSDLKEFTGDVWDYASNPSEMIKTLFGKMVKIDGVSGKAFEIGGNMVDYLADKAVGWAKGLFESASSGDDSIGANGVYTYLMNIAKQLMSKYNMVFTSGLRPGDPYDHGKGLAVDIALPGVTNGSPIYRQAAEDAIKMPGVKYVITNGMWKHKGKSWVKWPDGDHYDHVHISGEQPVPGSSASTGGSGVDRWVPAIKKAAAMSKEKLSAADINLIKYRINKESGGNDKIIQSSAVWDVNMANGDPARGLLQYIPSTFRAWSRKGYGQIMNGFHQLLAMFNDSNWRSDIAGPGGWGPTGFKVHGSHADGLAYVPFDGYNATLHKGERVLTAEENRNYDGGNKLEEVLNYLKMIVESESNIILQADNREIARGTWKLTEKFIQANKTQKTILQTGRAK